MKSLIYDYSAEAIDEWKKRGMKDRFAIGYIKNHGLIIFVFDSPNEDLTPSEIMRDLKRKLDHVNFISTPMVRQKDLSNPDNYPQIPRKY